MNLRATKLLIIGLIVASLLFSPGSGLETHTRTTVLSMNQNSISRHAPAAIAQTEFTGPSHPIFHNVTGANSQIVIERNDTLNQGAYITANKNENITIWYKVVQWDSTTMSEPLLYGEDGGNQLNSTITQQGLTLAYNYSEIGNITLDYLSTPLFLENVNISYFKATIKPSIDFITFYAYMIAGQGYIEGKGAPYPLIQNLIATNQAVFTSTSQYPYFLQTENVTIFFNATNIPNNATYALEYRTGTSSVLTSSFTAIPLNLTLPNQQNDVDTSVNLGTFDLGTVIEFRVAVRYNDSTLHTERSIVEPALHRVDIADGTPELTFSVNTTYSNTGQFQFFFNSSVPRGVIHNYTLIINDTAAAGGYFEIKTPQLPVNQTSYNYTFSTPGLYEANLTVYTQRGLSANASVIVVFDNLAPVIEIPEVKNVSTLQLTSNELSFNLEINDTGKSGIDFAIVSYGDGISEQFTETTLIKHTYQTTGFYNVTIYVQDKAENGASTSFTVSITPLTYPGRVSMSPLSIIFGFFAVVSITIKKQRKH